MAEKLLPCPFCGGEAVYCNTSPGVWRVECIECGATSNEREGHDAMMTTAVCRTIWNRRSPPPAVEGGWREIASRITEYLSAGGLFNPEMMDHQKVRDLLIDARDALGGKKP